jgi:hypothetical protein
VVVGALAVLTLQYGAIIGSSSSSSSSSSYQIGVEGQYTLQLAPLAGMQTVKQDPSRGMCRHNYSVPIWSGEQALVCDPGVCEGRDKLQLMAAPSNMQRRWSPAHEASYMGLYHSGRIEGWVDVSQPWAGWEQHRQPADVSACCKCPRGAPHCGK